MRREIGIICATYILAVLFFTLDNTVGKEKIEKMLMFPLGKSFSVVGKLKTLDSDKKNTVYGFLPYWSLDEMEYLQLDKLTDISYFALSIDSKGNVLKTLEDGTQDPGYLFWRKSEKLSKLIDVAKTMGTRFSLTIISHDDKVSNEFLNCRSCWNNFLQQLEKELDFRKIRDLNIDFEYTELVGKDTADKYTEFVNLVNKSLDKKYRGSFIVISSFADSFIRNRLTKPEDLAKVSDGIFIMAYDFHRPTSENAGSVAPIGGKRGEEDYDISTMLNDYLSKIPSRKLILGVPYYGYNWVVYNAQPNAKRVEGSDSIGFSKSQTYADVLETIIEYNPKINWDDESKSPYFTYQSNVTGSLRQVYYENADSLRAKYKLAKKLNLKGVGIWALGYDKGYQELWDLLKEEWWPL